MEYHSNSVHLEQYENLYKEPTVESNVETPKCIFFFTFLLPENIFITQDGEEF